MTDSNIDLDAAIAKTINKLYIMDGDRFISMLNNTTISTTTKAFNI